MDVWMKYSHGYIYFRVQVSYTSPLAPHPQGVVCIKNAHQPPHSHTVVFVMANPQLFSIYSEINNVKLYITWMLYQMVVVHGLDDY
jgi:hypothetical protein